MAEVSTPLWRKEMHAAAVVSMTKWRNMLCVCLWVMLALPLLLLRLKWWEVLEVWAVLVFLAIACQVQRLAWRKKVKEFEDV